MKGVFHILKALYFFKLNFFQDLYVSFIRNIEGNTGIYLRLKYYEKRLKRLGKNVIIDTNVYLSGAEYISIGNDTHIDKYVMLIGSPSNLDLSKRVLVKKDLNDKRVITGEINIGNNCHISQYVIIAGYGGVLIGDDCTLSYGAKIYSLTSQYNNPYDTAEVISIQPYTGKSPTIIGPVVLEKNVWAGINVLINPGVHIGQNSFIRSNSVVLKSFEENSFIAGDPANRIKNRYS